MGIRRSRRRVARRRLERVAYQLLDCSTLCAISTVSPRSTAHVNTAYFAWEGFRLFWLSDPTAAHSRNIRARRTTAVAVYDARGAWGEADRGIQLFGVARELPMRGRAAAERAYSARFPASAGSAVVAYRFYRFDARRVKVFDEAALGSGVFVTARVEGSGLNWERTEITSGDV